MAYRGAENMLLGAPNNFRGVDETVPEEALVGSSQQLPSSDTVGTERVVQS